MGKILVRPEIQGGATVNGVEVISSSGNVVVDGAELTITSQTTGDLLYFNGTSWVRLGIGATGYVLTSNGPGLAPYWAVGTTGPTGYTGPQGPTGPTGYTGYTGYTGGV